MLSSFNFGFADVSVVFCLENQHRGIIPNVLCLACNAILLNPEQGTIVIRATVRRGLWAQVLDKIGLEKEVDARMLMMRMIDRNIHRQSKKCPNADLVLSLGVFLAAGAPCVTRCVRVSGMLGVPLWGEASLSANFKIWETSQGHFF